MPLDGSLRVLCKVVSTNHELRRQIVIESNQEREHSLINHTGFFEGVNEKLGHVSQGVRSKTEDAISHESVQASLCHDRCDAVVLGTDLVGGEADLVSSSVAEDSA